jgi:dihydropteroate synthase
VTAPAVRWTTARGSLSLDRPLVVGILNITPDSFSDGGAYLDPAVAVQHAEAMAQAGAGMIDVGAESTRPGRPDAVPEEEEWRRLEPVLNALARQLPNVPVSIDTVKSGIAERSLRAGAWAINDVSGLRLDARIADICARERAGLILMHSRGTVQDMATYDHATYDDVAVQVAAELSASVRMATARGVAQESIVIDPGLGFAKNPDQSKAALQGVPALVDLGFPVMIGPSRKRFLGLAAGASMAERDDATAAACATGYLLGARLFRVHAIAPTVEALAAVQGIRAA